MTFKTVARIRLPFAQDAIRLLAVSTTAAALILFPLFSQKASGQLLKPIKWSVEARMAQDPSVLILDFQAAMDLGWFLYSSDFQMDPGPTPTTFEFQPHPSYELSQAPKPQNPIHAYDSIFEGNYTYFDREAVFRAKARILEEDYRIGGVCVYQVCSKLSGQCILFEDDFLFTPKLRTFGNPKPAAFSFSKPPAAPPAGAAGEQSPRIAGDSSAQRPGEDPEIGKPTPDRSSPKPQAARAEKKPEPKKPSAKTPSAQDRPQETTPPEPGAPVTGESRAEPKRDSSASKPEESTAGAYAPGSALPDLANNYEGLVAFMIVSFLAGLAALLTPCVFPLIPLTLAYFSRGKASRLVRIRNTFAYGISIVLIYILIGTVVSPFMGPTVANELATSWELNLLFFAVFLLFSLSFFGWFDITIPSGIINRVDALGESGGLPGIFFMALTLVLVSFSCTGPIVGSILVESASSLTIKPIAGMFSFSLAFALPFMVLSFFPSLALQLPKSGGWLHSVKVVLGFLELAFSLKFLSAADQAYHWHLLDREIFLALWIVIFTLLGYYLLGKIRLPGDSDSRRTTVPGLMMAIMVFSFVIYLVPGMFGAPLKALAGYIPPTTHHDFNLIEILRQESPSRGTVSGEDGAALTCGDPTHSDFLKLPHGNP